MTALVWFRNDLRLDDHEALRDAIAHHHGDVVPVYCIDERWLEPIEGVPGAHKKMGAYRAKFLLESLDALRESLRALGSGLVVRCGIPEEQIVKVARDVGAEEVVFFEEVTDEEMRVEGAVRAACHELGIKATGYWGATLYHVGDLPFYLEDMPEVFTACRKKLEKESSVRAPIDAPRAGDLCPLPEHIDVGCLPSLVQLGYDPQEARLDERRVLGFKGGEPAARARLEHYFFEADCLRRYKETRNGLIGKNDSSKFSAWLALGAISARRVFTEVKRYERERTSNSSTYWMIFELIWRDFFRFLAMKEGNQLFRLEGIRHTDYTWQEDEGRFARWVDGETGVPFVDANMRELAKTGFMSNRGRQNVASFFAKGLGIDWRWGASYFESVLIDYDPCSNWGNWQYVAGVGSDPRDRKFNVVGQGERYDKNGRYIRLWVPELEGLPVGAVHAPWRYGDQELKRRFDVQLGVDYPHPITPMDRGKRGEGKQTHVF